MEPFSKRDRKTLNERLGTDVAKPLSDSTFRLLLAQLDVEGFQGPAAAAGGQPGVKETVDTLVCDGCHATPGHLPALRHAAAGSESCTCATLPADMEATLSGDSVGVEIRE